MTLSIFDMIKGIIFDFNRTLYNPDTKKLEEGALALLNDLYNYRLCLVAKRTTEDKENLISGLGLNKYFLDIQIIDGHKQESHFQRSLAQMRLSASQVTVVGDRIKEEIKLANMMNMQTIWYRQGKFADELPKEDFEFPTYTITKLEDLVYYL